MENLRFEFRHLTRRSLIALACLTILFACTVAFCIISYLLTQFAPETLREDWFNVVIFVVPIIVGLASGCIISMCIARVFRKKLTIDIVFNGANFDNHKNLNQMFQWEMLKKVTIFKIKKPLYGFNQTTILEFEQKRIEILIVNGPIPLLSKKDKEQYLQFIQYLHKQILDTQFTLESKNKTVPSILVETVLNIYDGTEYRYVFVRK